MRTAMLSLAAVLFAATAWGASTSGPAEITFPGKLGSVRFPHAKHQQKLKIPCLTCHHVGTDPARCSACHGTKGDVPVIRDIYHELCKGCHQEKGAGPATCKGCHDKIK